jgi:hypothetical protein
MDDDDDVENVSSVLVTASCCEAAIPLRIGGSRCRAWDFMEFEGVIMVRFRWRIVIPLMVCIRLISECCFSY